MHIFGHFFGLQKDSYLHTKGLKNGQKCHFPETGRDTEFCTFLGGRQNRPKSAIFGEVAKNPDFGPFWGVSRGWSKKGSWEASKGVVQEGGIQGVAREVTREVRT